MIPPAGAERTHRSHAQSDRDSRAADRARIAKNRSRIAKLERSISLLEEENDELQDRLDAYAYPVLTLPNEIVSEIFVHFLPVYPETPPIIGDTSPNVLGQICRRWRDIAFSTPRLWRAIPLCLENGRLAQRLHLLETWLRRSGSCLLSINVDLEYYSLDIEPFLVAIAAQRARWEHLRLHSYSADFLLNEAVLPSLRTLFIEKVPLGAKGVSLASTLRAAPFLRTVAVRFPEEDFITLYPWSQLTMFDGHGLTPEQCVDFLTEAVNLVYCRLDVDDGATQSLFATVPCLTTFILHGSSTSNSAGITLDALTLPALVTLEISEYRHQPIASLKSLISRSKCSIQELYITYSNASPAAYRLVVPTVDDLTFNVGLPWVNPRGEPEDEEPDLGYGDAAGTESDSTEGTDDSE
ncbi:hypothetical protein C8R46DRAFT_1212860 [Mycena filopes]|nr:hypothetical protein C8R46DRAFT_1212860 [Mycena filopes]